MWSIIFCMYFKSPVCFGHVLCIQWPWGSISIWFYQTQSHFRKHNHNLQCDVFRDVSGFVKGCCILKSMTLSVRCVSSAHRYLRKQCVAVSTQRLLMIVPPQRWMDMNWMLTCQGHAPTGASCPPTIRDEPGGPTKGRFPQPHKQKNIKFPCHYWNDMLLHCWMQWWDSSVYWVWPCNIAH